MIYNTAVSYTVCKCSMLCGVKVYFAFLFPKQLVTNGSPMWVIPECKAQISNILPSHNYKYRICAVHRLPTYIIYHPMFVIFVELYLDDRVENIINIVYVRDERVIDIQQEV